MQCFARRRDEIGPAVVSRIRASAVGVRPRVGQQSSGKRKIIIDQDAAGPGGTDQQSILLADPVSANRSSRHHRRDRRRLAQRGSRAHAAHAGNHRTHRYSGCAGSRVSAGAAQRGNRTLGAAVRLRPVGGSVDSAALSSGRSVGRYAGGKAHHQTAGRRRGAFSGAHGPQVSA